MQHAPIRRHPMSTRACKAERVSREEKRLKSLFRRLLLVSIVAPAAIIDACSTSSKSQGLTELPDATIGNDGGTVTTTDGGPVTDAQTICAPTSIYVDANLPDGAIDCDIYNDFSCSIPVVPYNDCFFALNDCPTVCPGVYFFNCRAYGNWCLDGSILTSEDGGVVLDDGSVVALDPQIVECATCPNGAGRRPHGLRNPQKTRDLQTRSDVTLQRRRISKKRASSRFEFWNVSSPSCVLLASSCDRQRVRRVTRFATHERRRAWPSNTARCQRRSQ
jgi:hypothetical protein